MAEETNKIRVKLVRSIIGRPEKHKKIVRSLGIKKLNQTVEHYDTPQIRGMIEKVKHLVTVE
jgi:large subunit ribosomal protein L30